MLNHVFGYSGLRNMTVEFQQLPLNPLSAPQRIGWTHRSNETSYHWINEGISGLFTLAFLGPIKSKPLPVLSKNGLWLHKDTSLCPVQPYT